jgi:hypothetical protein
VNKALAGDQRKLKRNDSENEKKDSFWRTARNRGRHSIH